MSTMPSDISSTLAERHQTHGSFVENARIAQHLREFYRSCPGWYSLSEVQKEVLDANIGKDSRILSGNPNEPDHWRDKAGYSTLGFNWLTGGTL
jgi:hypothetical protein